MHTPTRKLSRTVYVVSVSLLAFILALYGNGCSNKISSNLATQFETTSVNHPTTVPPQEHPNWPPPVHVKIRSDRPRFMIDANDVNRIREAIKSYSASDFNALNTYVERRLLDKPVGSLGHWEYTVVAQRTAFVALINQNPKLIRRAIDHALWLSDIAPDAGDDIPQREKLITLASVYDWLYPQLSDAEKNKIRNAMVAQIDQLRYYLDPAKASFTGGHSRHGGAAIISALIAMYPLYDEADGDKTLDIIRNQFENGHNTFQSWVAADGGYHMGWRYGFAYTKALPYVVYEKATGVRWNADWRPKQAEFLLYGLRGDDQLPKYGDAWDMLLVDENTTQIVTVSSALFKSGVAEWLWQNKFSSSWEPYRMWRIMYRDPDVKATSPESLPLARHFKNSGFVVHRDAWDHSTSQLIFKSSSFMSYNHQHKDQNSIELSYKGSLLINSGYYDYFGSPHFENYFSRTIASNSLIVHDPSEKFVMWGRSFNNDGGQKTPNPHEAPVGSEPVNLTEALSAKYKLDGVTGFAVNAQGSWSQGDASKAYTAAKLSKYIRDILVINRPNGRKHPYYLILDRVELPKENQPKILFHPVATPTISGNSFSFSNETGGRLHAEVLLPGQAQLSLVGAPGQEFTVNGVQFSPTKNGPDMGVYRIEVSPGTAVKNTRFLSLLAVDDTLGAREKPLVLTIDQPTYAGALVGEELYLINFDASTPTKLYFAGAPFRSVKKIFVAGLDPGKTYSFHMDSMILTTQSPQVISFTK